MANYNEKAPEGTPVRRVIDFATHEFFSKGVKSVTMDDIAHGLQMSKRTLYQLFADKEQLVIACIELLADGERKLAAALLENNHNVLEIVLRIIEYRIKMLEKVSPQYIIDIARYETVREYIKKSREQGILRAAKFLRLGTEQGYFRSDVNFNLVLECIFTRADNYTPPTIYEKFNIHDYFINMGILHLRGCCTAKGIEIVDQFIIRYREEYIK